VRQRTLIVSGAKLTVEMPETRRERARGLLRRTTLGRNSGMLFERCRSVHTFGMRFPITVVALDRDLRVVTVRRMPPRRLMLPKSATRHVLECSVDAEIRPGERVALAGDELEEVGADETADDRAGERRGDDDERHEPADGARKRDGLAASFGGPEAEDLEQLAHDSLSARTEHRLSVGGWNEGVGGPRLYFRG
jgi:uncharacterized membrane protein (UPF0127 family)